MRPASATVWGLFRRSGTKRRSVAWSLKELRRENFEHCTCLGYPRPLPRAEAAVAVAVVAPAVPLVAALVGPLPPRAREAQPQLFRPAPAQGRGEFVTAAPSTEAPARIPIPTTGNANSTAAGRSWRILLWPNNERVEILFLAYVRRFTRGGEARPASLAHSLLRRSHASLSSGLMVLSASRSQSLASLRQWSANCSSVITANARASAWLSTRNCD
ncbi:hypothetical protein ACVWW6_008642 [Bradyrhizobium sp. USDA 3311]